MPYFAENQTEYQIYRFFRATAIILTAGHGTKLWPYSVIRPKCLVSVSNRPLIVHQAEALQSVGFERIIVAGFLLFDHGHFTAEHR